MSGGFYKYRCKYFYSHNCPNWVWVNNSPCASCLADGRDGEHIQAPSWEVNHDIVVPCVQNGILQYVMMELIAPSKPGEHWTLRDKTEKPATSLPMPTPSSFSSSVPSLPGPFQIG
ncbi:hypothetical protein B0I35DRAFT_451020 [Stachybotrys elegans]|uniref:Uncharacterized protein n=1 Tax=Stachybotrys elegans TaxID=80388 RepID=A0A8K0SY53_9HYPO|nr:hypothetical protein B0I35DRAFT_451020 [Stachybotrys elegans]